MKAKIVDRKELKMSPAEREAESLLRRLTADKAIEVSLDGASARTVRRAFSKAATNLGLTIQLRTKDERVYVLLRQEKPSKQGAVNEG